MKKWVTVRIKWLTIEEGGRSEKIGVGTHYCPLIMFHNEGDISESWSAEMYTTPINEDNEATMKMSFLSPQAPFDFLQKGALFSLYEGFKFVAQGVVLADRCK